MGEYAAGGGDEEISQCGDWPGSFIHLGHGFGLFALSELIFVLLAAVPVIFSVSKQRYKRFGVARISKYCEGYGEIMELAESKLNNA